MVKLTQKNLIEQIKMLKEIKPRQEWVSLLKSQILAEEQEVQIKAESVGFIDMISSLLAPRKLAYSFAVVLFLVVGIFGMSKLSPIEQPASLAVAFNSQINSLVQVTKEGKTDVIPSAQDSIKSTASALVKNLKSNLVSKPQTIKDIASSLKTLADMPGSDLTTNSDVKDLYQTVVQGQISDLQKTTLTIDQQKILKAAEGLYDQGEYADALEQIMLINK